MFFFVSLIFRFSTFFFGLPSHPFLVGLSPLLCWLVVPLPLVGFSAPFSVWGVSFTLFGGVLPPPLFSRFGALLGRSPLTSFGGSLLLVGGSPFLSWFGRSPLSLLVWRFLPSPFWLDGLPFLFGCLPPSLLVGRPPLLVLCLLPVGGPSNPLLVVWWWWGRRERRAPSLPPFRLGGLHLPFLIPCFGLGGLPSPCWLGGPPPEPLLFGGIFPRSLGRLPSLLGWLPFLVRRS